MKQNIPETWFEIDLTKKIKEVLGTAKYDISILTIEDKPIIKLPMIQNGRPRIEIVIEYNGDYNLTDPKANDDYIKLVKLLRELDFGKFILVSHGQYGGAPRRKKVKEKYIKTLFVFYPHIPAERLPEIKETEEQIKEKSKAFERARQGLPSKKEDPIEGMVESGIDTIVAEIEKNLDMAIEFEAEKPCRNKNTIKKTGSRKKKKTEVKNGKS
jgi:hypothetical protein